MLVRKRPISFKFDHVCGTGNFANRLDCLARTTAETAMIRKKQKRYKTFYLSAMHFKIVFWMTERLKLDTTKD